MCGIYQNKLVKVAYKTLKNGEIGFKFRSQDLGAGVCEVGMNKYFNLFKSTVSSFDGRKLLISENVSSGAVLPEKKFLALLNFLKSIQECLTGGIASAVETIEGAEYKKHRRSTCFVTVEYLNLDQENKLIKEIEAETARELVFTENCAKLKIEKRDEKFYFGRVEIRHISNRDNFDDLQRKINYYELDRRETSLVNYSRRILKVANKIFTLNNSPFMVGISMGFFEVDKKLEDKDGRIKKALEKLATRYEFKIKEV